MWKEFSLESKILVKTNEIYARINTDEQLKSELTFEKIFRTINAIDAIPQISRNYNTDSFIDAISISPHIYLLLKIFGHKSQPRIIGGFVKYLKSEYSKENIQQKSYSNLPFSNLCITEENQTSWLKILNEALLEHFPEDRLIDPKKATVVEWILKRAKEEGITESENIANAIFTIIKPLNHNPKKKKG